MHLYKNCYGHFFTVTGTIEPIVSRAFHRHFFQSKIVFVTVTFFNFGTGFPKNVTKKKTLATGGAGAGEGYSPSLGYNPAINIAYTLRVAGTEVDRRTNDKDRGRCLFLMMFF